MTKEKLNKARIFSFVRWRRVIVVFTIAFFIPIAIVGWREAYRGSFETTPPLITLIDHPIGIGSGPAVVSFSVEDTTSGLSSVKAWIEQRGTKIQLGNTTSFSTPTAKQKFTLPLPSTNSGLVEGEASLFIEATDNSMWKSGALETIPLLVDFIPPAAKLLKVPDRIATGGVASILFRYLDNHPARCEVYLVAPQAAYRSLPLPCIQANRFNEQTKDPSEFISYLTVPKDAIFPAKFELVMYDRVGNTTTIQLESTPQQIDASSKNFVVTRAAFRQKVQEDFESYRIFLEKRKGMTDVNLPTDQMKPSELLNLATRLAQRFTQEKLVESRQTKYWNSNFLRQPSEIILKFNESLRYDVDSIPYILPPSTGAILELPSGEKQVAAIHDGFVIAAEQLGSYHEAVLIDHGMGVTSLYANLQSTKVTPGRLVKRGDVIGHARLGVPRLLEPNDLNSSKSNSDQPKAQALIEIRIGGIAVDPVPWWKEAWVRGEFESVFLRN